jgi:predicted ATP-grasp superfamily ATP-dependent carboligase
LGNPCWTFKTAVLGNSAKEPIAVYNSGNSTLNISNVTITGTNPSEFSQTNTCTSVAPGAKCVITVTFTPSSVGPQSASVMITDNAPGSPHNIFLDGSGEN